MTFGAVCKTWAIIIVALGIATGRLWLMVVSIILARIMWLA